MKPAIGAISGSKTVGELGANPVGLDHSLRRRPDQAIYPAYGPSKQSLRGLDGLNFFLADVQTGVGPFLATYLFGHGWNEQRVLFMPETRDKQFLNSKP